MTGRVEAGILSGPVNISYPDSSVLQAWLLPAGCLSGLARRDFPAGQSLVGRLERGEVVGGVWLVDPDNVGHLYTDLTAPQPDLSLALFTGPDVVWVYPDLSTALK